MSHPHALLKCLNRRLYPPNTLTLESSSMSSSSSLAFSSAIRVDSRARDRSSRALASRCVRLCVFAAHDASSVLGFSNWLLGRVAQVWPFLGWPIASNNLEKTQGPMAGSWDRNEGTCLVEDGRSTVPNEETGTTRHLPRPVPCLRKSAFGTR